MKNVSIHTIADIAILTAMMTILGGIKIPNLIPGVEFQLSAPLAVAICAAFGFRKYIICGCLSSLIGLVLGTQNFIKRCHCHAIPPHRRTHFMDWQKSHVVYSYLWSYCVCYRPYHHWFILGKWSFLCL